MSSPRRSLLNISDETDDERWLYRRMLSDSQHIRRLQQDMPAESKISVLRQALNDLELPQDLFQGIKVWKITSSKSNFVPRYVTIDKTRQFICLTHRSLPQKVLSATKVYRQLPKRRFWNPKKESKQFFDIADIDAWHVGLVATQRAERAREMESTTSSADQSFDELASKKLLTLYFKGGKTLDLIVPKSRHLNELIFALNETYSTYHKVQPWISRDALFLRYIWCDIDFDKHDIISQSEFEAICYRISFRVTSAKHAFLNYTPELYLASHECADLLQSLKPKSPSFVLWNYLFGKENREITVKELHQKFLLEIQGELDTTPRQAQAMLSFMNAIELEHHDQHQQQSDKSKNTVQKHRFHAFLHSELNDAYDPEMLNFPQVLDRPISEYWINTSHSTDLAGDELNSKSSVEAYMTALLRGCKCLDLKCWDGPVVHGKPVPVIFHGHTLTGAIQFRHVCQVVAGYLKLYPDSYPIILSLENHCSGRYQRAMVDIIKEVLGKNVFFPSSKLWEAPLPSPELLRGKVVIKGERPAEPESDEEEEIDYTDFEQPLKSSWSWQTKSQSSHTIVAGLAAITLLHDEKFESFNQSMEQAPNQMHSIAESKLPKILRQDDFGEDRLREFNQLHMTRTYPGGSHLDSSNYNPIQAWSLGCQMVALNFQSGDTPMLLNDGLFRQVNGAGYVLKPDFVLGQDQPKPTAVFIRILSGCCLPKSNDSEKGERVDPFVSVTLHDVRNFDKREVSYTDTHTTEVVDDNGYSPVWRDQGKKFTVLQPEVAMLLFQVSVKDPVGDDLIASAAIPVSCLRKGYRSIQLYDKNNHRSGAFRYASLLAHIEY